MQKDISMSFGILRFPCKVDDTIDGTRIHFIAINNTP